MALLAPELAQVLPDGDFRLNFHPGQLRAWDSPKRVVALIAGFQGGKTEFLVHWLYREIQLRGPGDYLFVSPTYKLMSRKALPTFKHVFESVLRLGRFVGGNAVFTFHARGMERTHAGWDGSGPRTQVFFGHAGNPDSLESATAKAAVLDEAGQKGFRLGSFQAIQRRLAIHRGRTLIATTPYDLGWLKQKIYDPWARSGRDHPEIEVVNFDSTLNPAFPKEEAARMRRDLPGWLYNMMVRGLFERPAGLIYDCFSQGRCCEPRTRVPDDWPRYAGLDFGKRNTAALSLAERLGADRRPTGQFVVYREHHPGEKISTAAHVEAILKDEPRMPVCVGGARSEDEWRAKFASAGLPVREPPVHGVEVGIQTVYEMIKAGDLLVMEDLHGLIDELESYSRVTDEAGNVGEEIDDDSSYHYLAALRYVCLHLRRGGRAWGPRRDGGRSVIDQAPPGVFGR